MHTNFHYKPYTETFEFEVEELELDGKLYFLQGKGKSVFKKGFTTEYRYTVEQVEVWDDTKEDWVLTTLPEGWYKALREAHDNHDEDVWVRSQERYY